MTIAEIKKAMKSRSITRKQLAKRIGRSYSYVSQILNDYIPLKEDISEKIEAALRE